MGAAEALNLLLCYSLDDPVPIKACMDAGHNTCQSSTACSQYPRADKDAVVSRSHTEGIQRNPQ